MLRNIPEERVIARIRADNPWWENGEIDGFFAHLKRREYFASFKAVVDEVRAGKVRRAPILMGPRRVGKTVLLYHLVQSLIDEGEAPNRIAYLSVEHPVFNGRGLDESVELATIASGEADAKGRVFIFDEIQYLRDWEVHLKALVDRNPSTTLIASGSAAAALRMKSNESGAGRFTDFLLPPLTFHEYVVLLDKADLVTSSERWSTTNDLPAFNELFVDYLNFGGYPEVALSETIRRDPARYVRQDIIDKVLLRDLPSLYGIADIQELNSLFTSLAYNTANEVSLDKLSQSSNVAKNTVKRYLEYLEAAFLVKRVHRVDQSAKKFERATTFKIYLTNPSIRAALFSPTSADDDDAGAMVETAVFAQWFHSLHGDDLHYARWKTGDVDLVKTGTGTGAEWATEVKWSDRATKHLDELRALVEFCKQHKLVEAVVTTRSETQTRTVDGIEIELIPASLYCFTIGQNVVGSRKHALRGGAMGPAKRPPRK